MLPFGETVLLWRIDRRMTQDDLAQAAKISRPNLSAIERGEREVTLKTLRSIACALDVRPGVLVDGVAPGPKATRLSRDDLERIARAVVDDVVLGSRYEQALTIELRHLFRARVKATGSRRRMQRGIRARDRAYARLKSIASPETIVSLLSRVSGLLAQR